MQSQMGSGTGSIHTLEDMHMQGFLPPSFESVQKRFGTGHLDQAAGDIEEAGNRLQRSCAPSQRSKHKRACRRPGYMVRPTAAACLAGQAACWAWKCGSLSRYVKCNECDS